MAGHNLTADCLNYIEDLKLCAAVLCDKNKAKYVLHASWHYFINEFLLNWTVHVNYIMFMINKSLHVSMAVRISQNYEWMVYIGHRSKNTVKEFYVTLPNLLQHVERDASNQHFYAVFTKSKTSPWCSEEILIGRTISWLPLCEISGTILLPLVGLTSGCEPKYR